MTTVLESLDSVAVTLDDGQVLEADLLIGADGVHSAIRALAFGPEEDFLHYLGFHVGAYSFRDAGLAALVGNRIAVTDTRNEAMFFYRLRDGRITAMAVHRTKNPEIPADPQALLRSRYRNLGWICPAALQHCPDDLYYDQVAQIRMPRWHTGRVILLGDAAAAVSLLAGQGASSAWPPPLSWRTNSTSIRESARPSPPSKHGSGRWSQNTSGPGSRRPAGSFRQRGVAPSSAGTSSA
ncbi:FAD-dependent monooxygenase [Arthrobacter sp. OVS8]|nr:FAD-dependent monooxygenase [Arthrobacter sp. OVS8]